jgi:hypothetical protein
MMSAEEPPPGLREKDLLPGRMMRDCMRCLAASASAAWMAAASLFLRLRQRTSR